MANLNPGDTIIMTGTFSNNLEAQTTNLMTVDRIQKTVLFSFFVKFL